MFKDLRTSTKLFLLCAVFAGAIILATYSLIEEKQIAIGFVRKELAGTQYLNALRQIVRPLRQLEELAGNVRETKNYGLRVNLERRDEIGQLATAFNAMLAELASVSTRRCHLRGGRQRTWRACRSPRARGR